MNQKLFAKSNQSILFFIIFFFSGFSALIYQVIWQRWLVFFTGISSVSISLIVSAFMAGLGIGYLVGGKLADLLPKRFPIIGFIVAEIGIGAFALFSKQIIYDWLLMSNYVTSSSPLVTYIILFLVLLIPTFLMGISLPMLSKSLKQISIEYQAKFISLLYFTNTLGAAIGVLFTTFIFIPSFGFRIAVEIGAVINLLCGLSALIIYFQTKNSNLKDNNIDEDSISAMGNESFWNSTILSWTIQYTISGFMAISFEIIWFRMIDVMMKSYAVTFPVILAIYLGSMAMGTYFGVYFITNFKFDKLKVFLNVQYFLYLYIVLSIALLHYGIQNFSFLEYIYNYFRDYEAVTSKRISITTILLIPMFLMSIPTFIMGFSFSLSQVIIQNDYNKVGRRLGWLQFMNIVGSTLGAWFVTLIGFQFLGSSLTIKIISLVGFVYIAILIYKKFSGYIVATIYFTSLAVGLLFVPNHNKFWMNLGGMSDSEKYIFSEDETAISSIKLGEESIVFVNGLGQSHLPMEKDYIHYMLSAVPLFVHPNPEVIGIIGLGSSSTVYSAGGRANTKNIDCFEVIVNQPNVLLEYVRRTKDSSAYHILNDNRLNLILKDGRYAIFKDNKKYDILEADALRPRSSYSGNLYSVEFFEILKSKLKKNGIAVTWAPTERIKNGFCNVFPYVYETVGSVFLGSETPLDFNPDIVLERYDNDFTEKYYKKANIDAKVILNNALVSMKIIQKGKIIKSKNVNLDMWPKDEYELR